MEISLAALVKQLFKYHGNVQFPVAFRAPKLLLGVVAPVIAATQGWHARGVVVPVIAAKKEA